MAEQTPEEETARIRRLVLDICDGRVFTSMGLEPEEIRSSFMVLALAEKGQIPEDAAMVWESLNKAGPLAINGRPCFFSCHFETKEVMARVLAGVRAEVKRRESIEV